MNDWVEVENGLADGNRHIHLMANHAFGYGAGDPACAWDAWVDAYLVPSGAAIKVSKENGVFHLRGWWPYRGVVDVQPEGWPESKRFVCWALKGERVSQAMRDSTLHYTRVFGRYPGFAFAREIPANAEEGVEVDGVMLLPAEWAPQGCLMIGG